MEHNEIERLYGPWSPRTPVDVQTLLDGYSGRWWISGGWAIEAFTGIPRTHGDLDFSIPRHDVSALCHFLTARFDIWAAEDGSLRPLTSAVDQVPPETTNLWLRKDGAQPWEYDVLLEIVEDDRWFFRRDSRIARPLDTVVWTRDEIFYLRPEIQLLYKAKSSRGKDEIDFTSTLPLLDLDAKEWLLDALVTVHPDHTWATRLR